jgi:surfactin synthase thioesterase subunit
MGALIAFMVAVKLKADGCKPPLHVFISGTSAPSALSRKELSRHTLGKKEFLDEIVDFEGMPDEITRHQELLDYFEPILRSDFKATETYVYRQTGPVDMPFTVITGTGETMSDEDILLWQNETLQAIDFRKMEGKHFFIFKNTQAIIDIIVNKLQSHKNILSYE